MPVDPSISAAATIRTAVADALAGRITTDDAILGVTPADVVAVLHPQLVGGVRTVIATGVGASPGAASGRVAFTAEAAADLADDGHAVILVRAETTPDDVHGMMASVGILTTRGGVASHAAVVARGWGLPAVVGAAGIDLGLDRMVIGGVAIGAGDTITIDGGSGEVLWGAVDVNTEPAPAELDHLLAWADEVRGNTLSIRANADTAQDAAVARAFGADGIGLCRTEHMFLADDRLPLVRRMILAATDEEERAALAELEVAQRADFAPILAAMDGLPVTVRLLDPPLHEFLPSTADLEVREAAGALDDAESALLDAARRWAEQNPMLGIRGVRLGVLKPGLYAMQVRAVVAAVADRVAAGGDPRVEVMIPLVVTGAEMALARSWVEEAIRNEPAAKGAPIRIGTMIETPRAALRAADLAVHADFFSFGTNDLTQLTFGFSRDDVEGRLFGRYLELGLLPVNPFVELDQEGVGELIVLAAERGRTARPGLHLSLCGEHGGDPRSIQFLLACGLDALSCSPFRVPVARLAAAQAILRGRAGRRALN